jgi:hypothetical protein
MSQLRARTESPGAQIAGALPRISKFAGVPSLCVGTGSPSVSTTNSQPSHSSEKQTARWLQLKTSNPLLVHKCNNYVNKAAVVELTANYRVVTAKLLSGRKVAAVEHPVIGPMDRVGTAAIH